MPELAPDSKHPIHIKPFTAAMFRTYVDAAAEILEDSWGVVVQAPADSRPQRTISHGSEASNRDLMLRELFIWTCLQDVLL